MRQVWAVAHWLGFVLWLGGGLSAMAIGLSARREPREVLGTIARQLAIVYRAVMLPGAVLTVASGLVLTLMVYGAPGAMAAVGAPLMTMQGTGLLAAILTLLFIVPAASRAARLDPLGPHGPRFDALRRRTARLGMISGVLGLIALISGALMRP
jgi:hypothetical protein